jgi:uncharacterized protein (UPF0305 family)
MILELEELKNDRSITRQELLKLLKNEALNIHINDIIKACNYLIEEGKYVQSRYREKFYETYIKSFILRVKEIKEDKNVYNDHVNMEELKNSLKLLKDQEISMIELYPSDPHFPPIYQIISIYTSFVLDEPIHVVGTEFPGGFKVRYDDDNYFCPVKEKQENNPNAVCGFCIAVQDPELKNSM